jgi:class 3 adenylate cyclase
LTLTATEIRDHSILSQLAYAHSAATVAAIDEQMAKVDLAKMASDLATTIDEIAARVAISYTDARTVIRFAASLLPSKWRAVVNHFLDELDVLAMKVNPDFKAGKDV